MKNFFKLFGLIALVAVIGFSLLACGGGGGGGGRPGPGPNTPVTPGSSDYTWDDGFYFYQLTITAPQTALVFPGSYRSILAGTYVLNVYLLENLTNVIATSSGTASAVGVTVTFTPASNGTQSITGSFTLTIDTNSAEDTVTFVDDVTIAIAGGGNIEIEAGDEFPLDVARISLDKSATHTFASATLGYTAQTPLTVTVTNNGSKATGQLTVALSGANVSSFTLSAQTLASIPVDGTRTFNVRPNTGLSEGTYNATVTVSGSDIVDSRSFNVSFTVEPGSDTCPTCETGTPGLAYTIINYYIDNTVWEVNGVSAGTVTTGLVCIPAQHNGRPVIEIADEAFAELDITEMHIPNSVEYIGSSAFANCESLISVTIGNNVEYIGNYAFSGSGLTSITIPNSVTSIGDGAFVGCESLTSITLPNSVTSIGDGAFVGCESLTSITLPNSITSIGNYMFGGCTSLASITIPNSVTSIGSSAFSNTGLTSITIPNSVTHIDSMAFYGCESLTSVTIPNSVTSIYNHVFAGCTSLTSVTIGSGVTEISYHMFEDCISLTNITIPNNITEIGNYAFQGCTGLTSITIPNSITSIGELAFNGCTSLSSITIPNSVTTIGQYAFRSWESPQKIIIQGKANEAEADATFVGFGRWREGVGDGVIEYQP